MGSDDWEDTFEVGDIYDPEMRKEEFIEDSVFWLEGGEIDFSIYGDISEVSCFS